MVVSETPPAEAPSRVMRTGSPAIFPEQRILICCVASLSPITISGCAAVILLTLNQAANVHGGLETIALSTYRASELAAVKLRAIMKSPALRLLLVPHHRPYHLCQYLHLHLD